MDQRRLKVGDVVDDYCPRERRVTDHAIVAMIGDSIRQTRCTACDSEHPYKEARVPRVRRKGAAALYQDVLASATEPRPPAVPPAREPEPPPDETDASPPASAAQESQNGPQPPPPAADEGPVHRPLIRATLPRTDGAAPTSRPIPEFTVRQPGTRGRFRDDFRSSGFRNSGRGGQQGQGPGQGRPGRPGGSHQHQQHQPPHRRHGRPAPHKKRSR